MSKHNVLYSPCSSRKSMHCLKTVGSSSWSELNTLLCTATSRLTPNTAQSRNNSSGGREGGREGEREGERKKEKGSEMGPPFGIY